MSLERDDRVDRRLQIGKYRLDISIFRSEIQHIRDIEQSLNSVVSNNGIAFMLPALPGDDSYNKPVMNTDWLLDHIYLFII